jgi:MFS family permease
VYRLTPSEAGKAMGYISLASTLGVLIAPLLGGIVYAQAGYYAVFGMAFAVIGIDVLLRVALIEKKAALKWAPDRDVPLQVVCLNTDNERQGEAIHLDSKHQGQAVAPAADGGQGPKLRPRLPPLLILLRSKRILAAFWGTFVAGILMSSFDTTLPLFVKRTFGWDSTGGGLIFLALVIPNFSGPVVGECTSSGPFQLP